MRRAHALECAVRIIRRRSSYCALFYATPRTSHAAVVSQPLTQGREDRFLGHDPPHEYDTATGLDRWANVARVKSSSASFSCKTRQPPTWFNGPVSSTQMATIWGWGVAERGVMEMWAEGGEWGETEGCGAISGELR